MDESAPLIILSGPPGSGKSTTAEALAARAPRSVVVAGDWFLQNIRRGKIEPWLPESHEQNTRVMEITVRTARDYARSGYMTILEGIVGPWFLPTVRAQLDGVDAHYVVLNATLDICLARVGARGSGPADEVVAKMHRQFDEKRLDGHALDADRPTAELAAAIERLVASGAVAL